MDKYFLDKRGKAEARFEGSDKKKKIKFPLCLAIMYKDAVPLECPDFLLNTSKGKLFVISDNLLPEESIIKLHFYIPPKTKLLAEFSGKVIKHQTDASGLSGMLIYIMDFFHTDLKKLEEFLEHKRHLVDEEA